MRLAKSLPIFAILVEHLLTRAKGKTCCASVCTTGRLGGWKFLRRGVRERSPCPAPHSDVATFSRKRNTCDNKKLKKKQQYYFFTNIARAHKIKAKKQEQHKNRHPFRCKDYDAKDIVILEGLEAVRKRPGMYIGNTDVKGLHQILFEIIDNSVDEYNNFECNEIKIVIHEDESVTIEDNGRGIPCDIHEKTKKSALETVLTVLHSGAKFVDEDTAADLVERTSVGGMSSEIGEDERGGKGEQKSKAKVVEKLDEKNSKKKNPKEASQKSASQMYRFSSGLHGVGLSVANALSSFMKVKVFRGGKIHSIELEKGKVVTPLSVRECPVSKRGTQIHYKPDHDIFKNTIRHNAELIKNRIHQLAYLNDRLTFYFYDERSAKKVPTSVHLAKGNEADEVDKREDKTTDAVNTTVEHNNLDFYPYEVIKHEGGLNEYMESLTKNKASLFKDSNKIISISCHQKNVHIDLRIKWTQGQYHEHIVSFVNNVNTTDGGTHVDAMKYAISRCVNFNIKKNEATKNFVNIPGEYIREGMTAILSIKMNNPEFEGQTKTKLGSHFLKPILESAIFEKLSEIFDFEPNLLNTIYLKALQAKASDEEAKAARDLIRSKNNQYYSTILPGKLVDCISDDINRNEIFIVEGDSAAGSAKQARNREIQAILPLKGKILNVEKIKNNKRIFENSELKSLITAIGLSISCDNSKMAKGKNMLNNKKKDIKKKYDLKCSKKENVQVNNAMVNKKKNTLFDTPLRYGKIIIMTDADVDGEHIRILLLTFLYRFQKNIIQNGNVFVACPPLYKVTYNRFFDNTIKETVMKQFNVSTRNSKTLIHTYSDDELNVLLGLLEKDRSSHAEQRSVELGKGGLARRGNIPSEDHLSSLTSLDNLNFRYNSADEVTEKERLNTDDRNAAHTANTAISTAPLSGNAFFTFSKRYEIQRFKGLGEMMADQLWSTTMDPSVRKLIRVTVNDAMRANNLIFSLMGEDSKLRKSFILENSPAPG
ncbi:DNA gyrase subunit B, putative [Plasmodium knowlesi strain H]|uniref:DNA topoisomerase 2 n=3 Tax=Plasmodium knowlesi TaxID=5850 RepID=A0A5K1VDZ2_PLAKH|nr:DNA gyrase subunit B, putative [Plasmodium knowlesi strain H]OTN63763.1 DNA topoisomerase 2 [Plasmodium knowlesi]CAA9991193.1 DNA gyrase subunit B, putative [Plasmodium knowlesi strain H]SBO26245.1 DNA gyrase subunit B, putative [Plasmodium knowlesi strain H]SBO29400.1 DNA gyrase subunit B, putative [Plasmodium knowlesi strain H]VVS80667.1 DNA gyrase subunit B, putative [Plasmodium knowlesi strain H]|eukprot:XP_002262476.1 DNA gyrase subunit b, putative [Plasmodium knowlesi strain H]